MSGTAAEGGDACLLETGLPVHQKGVSRRMEGDGE